MDDHLFAASLQLQFPGALRAARVPDAAAVHSGHEGRRGGTAGARGGDRLAILVAAILRWNGDVPSIYLRHLALLPHDVVSLSEVAPARGVSSLAGVLLVLARWNPAGEDFLHTRGCYQLVVSSRTLVLRAAVFRLCGLATHNGAAILARLSWRGLGRDASEEVRSGGGAREGRCGTLPRRPRLLVVGAGACEWHVGEPRQHQRRCLHVLGRHGRPGLQDGHLPAEPRTMDAHRRLSADHLRWRALDDEGSWPQLCRPVSCTHVLLPGPLGHGQGLAGVRGGGPTRSRHRRAPALRALRRGRRPGRGGCCIQGVPLRLGLGEPPDHREVRVGVGGPVAASTKDVALIVQ
mmetsp:Transcript_57777/g.187729  ORF Transcript_57777/g.187729 Transcript_57777/m.187729 type:complete len:349 (+) Transcript_57777:2727-3773(+)